MPSVYFTCITAVLGTFRTMLNSSGKSRHPWIRGKFCLLLLVSMMLAVGASWMPCITLRKFLLILSALNRETVLDLVKFLHLLRLLCSFSPLSY